MLKTVNILNKRARFDYEIIETYTRFIELVRTNRELRNGELIRAVSHRCRTAQFLVYVIIHVERAISLFIAVKNVS